MYITGKENGSADVLSHSPCGEPPENAIIIDVQVGAIHTSDAIICNLLTMKPAVVKDVSFAEEQQKDPEILEMISYLMIDQLPDCKKKAKKPVAQVLLFTVVSRIQYFLDTKTGERKSCVVPCQLQQSVI